MKGSPQIALDIEPPFKEYHFIDIKSAKIIELRKLAAQRAGTYIYEGDCNSDFIRTMFSLELDMRTIGELFASLIHMACT